MADPDDILAPCSDAHCILAEQPRVGMHTQGGCRHLKEHGGQLNLLLRTMGTEILRLRAEVDRLRSLPVLPSCGDCSHLDGGMGGAWCTRAPRGTDCRVDHDPIPGPVGYGTPPPSWCPWRGGKR